ncbi:MAG: MMPL family transporter [Hyphomicrobiales bacterium]|nr:MMPL family transporter [Hyphomicrobiales bacterium]
MVTWPIVRIVSLSARLPWLIIALVLALAVGSAVYAKRHFAIKTDVNELISHDVPWAKNATDYMKNFPQWGIIAVIDAPTPEATEQATNKLAQALKARPEQFRAVSQPGGGEFFAKNGLLFLPRDDVAKATDGIPRADPLIGTLAADPSLRGVLDTLWLGLAGVQRGDLKLDDMARVMNTGADTAQEAIDGRPASFSWRGLARGKVEPNELRRFLLVAPVLDFTALQPGHAATEAIANIASDLKLDRDYQAQVRLTGRIPMEDDEFGTIKHNAELNAALTLLAVLIILWLALRSFRIIFACAVSLFAGLAISAAAGLAVVGAFNVISVAFFVLFVGLGVDFGIQFSVRYRAERHDHPELGAALRSAARKSGAPLALAAVATAVGFASFLPTAYRGLSELGQIAGMGMLIAFATSITLLPALLAVLNPPAEPHPMGFAWLAPVDRFLERHRIAVVAGTAAVVLLASPLLFHLPFDFNPLHLRSEKVPSVATYLELAKDPRAGASAIDILEPNLATADATAQRLAALPQVAQATTLTNLVPTDQDEKLKLIRAAAGEIDASLNPEKIEPPPTDADLVESLTSAAGQLTKIAGDMPGPGADAARRLGGLLSRLSQGDEGTRARFAAALSEPLKFSLDQLRGELKPEPVTVANIPPELRDEWLTRDGRARIQVLPKGDPNNTETLRSFVTSVTAVEPNATGSAVLLYEAGNTVVHAFFQSGVFALAAIALLLFITLRRVTDVLLTLVPLIVAGAVTLELCVILDLPLNFANIIALPLLLGVGVAFKVYYIMAWRTGKTALLQSSLTRAVVFSAMTTATAFGSLWFSSHPGTSSMGKLMALALVCTMAAAVLFQPALMGPPRSEIRHQ